MKRRNYDAIAHACSQAGDEGVAEPLLSSKNVASIMISSDFLKMDALVAACMQFVLTHTDHTTIDASTGSAAST